MRLECLRNSMPDRKETGGPSTFNEHTQYAALRAAIALADLAESLPDGSKYDEFHATLLALSNHFEVKFGLVTTTDEPGQSV